jgi:hypothetical protein
VTTPIYQASSKFYIQFIHDPSGEVVQQYNGYTWNDLLHSDKILDYVFDAVEVNHDSALYFSDPIKSIYPNVSDRIFKEQIRDNLIHGEILSDFRLLTITFTTTDQTKTEIIQKSMETGLLNFAADQDEIASMEIINSIESKLVIWDNHLHRAIIGGAVLFLLLALFAWWFYYILDDSLYTIADAEKRYPYPVVGILLKGETIETPSPYFAETKENLAYLLKDAQNPIYISVEKTPYPDGKKLREGSGVILEVPFGSCNGKKTDRRVSFMKNQDIKILGILIIEADKKFLKQYYNGKTKLF